MSEQNKEADGHVAQTSEKVASKEIQVCYKNLKISLLILFFILSVTGILLKKEKNTTRLNQPEEQISRISLLVLLFKEKKKKESRVSHLYSTCNKMGIIDIHAPV